MTKKIDTENLQDETELTLEDAETVVGGTFSNAANPQGIWDFSKKVGGTSSHFEFPTLDASSKDAAY